MRTLKKLGVLAVAVFAISVVGVASASAAQFTASAVGNLEGHALSGAEGKQVFTTNAGTVSCIAATTEGEIKSTAATEQEVTVNYGGCTAFGIVNVDISPATYNFHSSGTVDIKKEITITVTGGIFGTCTVKVPSGQTVGTVAFSNSGTNNILVNPSVTGIKYESSGGLCGSGTATNGTYVGKSEVNRVGGGSIQFDA
jgi:hypothetical protein